MKGPFDPRKKILQFGTKKVPFEQEKLQAPSWNGQKKESRF